MKKILVFFLLISSIISAQSEIYFTSQPTLSPDGKTIVFVYENDLWTVSANGGNALRLTGMVGRETNPSFSPDGKWIAFTGRQDGNSNIFVMPSNGGVIKQLTYHDAGDLVESWDWDSKHIYFRSSRYTRMSVFKINVNGGTPETMFEHNFAWPHNFVINPKTGDYLFNETWESSLFAHRKRYKGDYNPDIKSYNPNTKEFKVLTTYRGKDMFPTVDKKGNIYFVSDESNEEFNLYTFNNGVKTQLTNFSTSIKTPKVNADGGKIVFEKDYQIFLYDVKTNSSKKVEIKLNDINSLTIEKEFLTNGKITFFDVSHDNKKITFISRGELFVSDIEGKFVKQLSTKADERVKEVYWLKDNKTLLFNQTVKGWENLFTISADGKSKEKQLTFDEQTNHEIHLNDEKTKALYFSGRNELRVMDLESFKSETIVKDEFWANNNIPAYFSPDDKYIVYTNYTNFENDILVYSFEEKKSYNITKTGVSETYPFWSPDGKYIYFMADKYKPVFPWGWDDMEIYRVALTNFDSPFKEESFNKLFTEEKKDTSKPVVKIDFNNLKDRWERVASQPGNQWSPYVIQDGEETTMLFNSAHDNESSAIWKTVLKPFEKPKTEKISGANTSNMLISKSKDNYYVLIDGIIHKLNYKNSKTEKISISYSFTKNLQNEFEQMYYEAWANIAENFYDGNYHGADWYKLKDQYGKFLPYIRNRENLRRLSLDLQGELNASHQNFTSTGDEEESFYELNTLSTGILFENDNPYKVKRIISESPADKENKNVKPGDILTAVNDVIVDAKINREFYFSNPINKDEVKLTFNRNGKTFDVFIHPINTFAQRDLLYNEWINNNQNYVDKKSDKRISYVHMKTMTPPELNVFMDEMANELHYRDALILDLRHNRGGNVHDQVLQFLSQRPYSKWAYRDGKMTQQPNFAPAVKPIVLLINEQSLSDAEVTAAGFKALKLGKVIGTETYRWIIFTTNVRLVDGSVYRQPSWGCYTLEGVNIETNGVKPDIYIKNTFKDKIENKDPQLDKAIDEILKELK